MSFQRWLLLIALTGTFFAVCLQEINLNSLGTAYPAKEGLLTSADESSYFAPAHNFITTGTWKDNSPGISSYFQRTPGYGILYMCCLYIAGTKAFLLLKCMQIAAFFGSILLFGNILKHLIHSQKWILAAVSFYAFLPAYSGFMYFTLTESFTPFLLLWSVCGWLGIYHDPSQKPWSFILANACMLLFRPQLLLFTMIFGISFLLRKHTRTFLWTLAALLPLLAWNLRTISINGTWPGMHPIYSASNNSIYRPSHRMLTDLFRIWEHDGEVFHSVTGLLSADTSKQNLDWALAKVPEKYRQDATPILASFQQLQFYRVQHFKDCSATQGYFKGEAEFHTEISALTQRLISENPGDYYLRTPLHSLKKLVVSSQLNLHIFQVTYRGTWWMEMLRYISTGVILFSLLFTFITVLRFRMDILFWISAACCLTVFYLAFFQRMNEERYLTPLLPIALTVLMVQLLKWCNLLTRGDD